MCVTRIESESENQNKLPSYCPPMLNTFSYTYHTSNDTHQGS